MCLNGHERRQAEDWREAAESRHAEAVAAKCTLTEELNKVRIDLQSTELKLSFAQADVATLESQMQELAQCSSSDTLGLPPPAAAPAAARDKDMELGGNRGPVSEEAGRKVGKAAGLGFTFKRDSRSGNWQVWFSSVNSLDIRSLFPVRTKAKAERATGLGFRV